MSVPIEVNLELTREGDVYHGVNSSLDRSDNYNETTNLTISRPSGCSSGAS